MTHPPSSSAVLVPPDAPIRLDLSLIGAEPDSDRLAPVHSSGCLAPVRIFVGTEPGHHEAERVLLWSIRRHRTPDRAYEVHWIRPSDGRGHPSGLGRAPFWVPQLCDGRGRALYLSVFQVLLSDPAELFDLPMAECAVLGATPDTLADTVLSALLIDCAKLASIWSIDRALDATRQRLLDAVREHQGPLPTDWDGVPDHHSVGRSKRLHFDAPHTQPWRPFPHRFVYQSHPNADVWQELERDANDAGFEVFSRSSPSRRFASRFPAVQQPGPASAPEDREHTLSDLLDAVGSELVAHDVSIRESLAKLSTRRTSIYTLDGAAAWRHYLEAPAANDPKLAARWGATEVCDPDDRNRDATGRVDAVVCTNTLNAVPTEDLPWVLDEIFSDAQSLVHLGIRLTDRNETIGATAEHRSLQWWMAQIARVANRHTRVHWQVVFGAGDATEVRHGGRHLSDLPPTVWVLTDNRPGNTSQSTGLADSLGWPYTVKKLHFSAAARLHNRLLGASRIGINRQRSSDLSAPWPDLVIAAGRRSAPVAQWIRARNFGRTRLIHLGRKGGDAADHFDLVVTPSYGRLDPHPHRLITSAPINNIKPDRIQRAIEQFSDRFPGNGHPRIVVLVGGTSGQYRLDPQTARKLGEDVMRLAGEVDGSILATTSRRAGAPASEAFSATLSGTAHVYRWSADSGDENPYLAFLGLADAFVTTADSESMLSEAASLGRPIYIYPLPERASFGWMRIGRDWVYARAHAVRRGIRTQRGLDYWCARLIDLGFVRPTRDLRDLHEGLIREGVARHFGAPFDTQRCRTLSSEDRVVERVCALVGYEAQK